MKLLKDQPTRLGPINKEELIEMNAMIVKESTVVPTDISFSQLDRTRDGGNGRMRQTNRVPLANEARG